MNHADFLDPTTHVRLTRDFMDHDLRLDRLLELTHGFASAGSAALQLVLPAVTRSVQPNWNLLGVLDISSHRVGEVGDRLARALDALDTWERPRIEEVFDAVAGACHASERSVRSLVSVLVLGEQTLLPVAAVLEVMGSDRSLARLRTATSAFKAMQMIE